MTIFASLLLGALFSVATALIGYGIGADQDEPGIIGVVMAVVVLIVTFIFVLVLCAVPNA